MGGDEGTAALAGGRRYCPTDLQELNAEIIREFVEKLYVYNAERTPTGRRTQKVKIIWNCIGEFKPSRCKNAEENNEKSA